MDIGDATAQNSPSFWTVGVPFLGTVDAEVPAVLDGGLGAKDAACHGKGLVVELDRVPID